MRSNVIVSIVVVCLTGSQAFMFWGGGSRQEAEGEIDSACEDKARNGDCEFYTCFDVRHPCTRHNWALSYGWRFCTRFSESFGRFTEEGQRWITGSRNCTMQAMLRYYRRQHIICDDVEDDMKEAHAQCEEDHGVCSGNMLLDNKEVLMDIYKISRRTLFRFLMFVQQCGGTGVSAFMDWVKEQSSLIGPFFRNFKDLFD